MARNKFDISKLDTIIKKTIEAISNSKGQIYDIAEGSKKECKRLEEELNDLKEQLKQMFDIIDILEHDLKVSRSRLAMLSKKFTDRSDEELQKAYEKADNIRIQLVIKREQEQNLIVRRNELEIRLKDAYKTVEKAEDLMSQIGIALGYLIGDLVNLSSHIEDMQQCGLLGIKIIRAQEDERQRVARDIHDGPAQSMSNVVLKAEICEKLLDVDIDRVKGELRELKMVVRGCLQDIRRIIYDLRPMSLDDLGLIPTIERYISNYQDETGIHVRFKASGNSDAIRSIVSLTTFRIVQESLNNVKKHANANSIEMNITNTDHELLLNIFDNGKGFNIEEEIKNRHDTSSGFGLCSMKERVELLGGLFEIKSEIGEGTELNIKIPLNIEKEGQNE